MNTNAQKVLENGAFAVVAGAKTNPFITVQYLDDFFKAPPVALAAEAQTRMSVFLKNLAQVDVQSIGSILKEYASKERHEKGNMLDKWDASRTRAKEVRQIYGAQRFAGLKAETMGWDTAYKASREALMQAKVLWDGSAAPTPEQQERRKLSSVERAKAEMVKNMAQDVANAGGVPDYAIIAEKAGAEVLAKKARGAAFNLVKQYGAEFALVVGQCLPAIVEVSKQFGDLKDVTATDMEDKLATMQAEVPAVAQ